MYALAFILSLYEGRSGMARGSAQASPIGYNSRQMKLAPDVREDAECEMKKCKNELRPHLSSPAGRGRTPRMMPKMQKRTGVWEASGEGSEK